MNDIQSVTVIKNEAARIAISDLRGLYEKGVQGPDENFLDNLYDENNVGDDDEEYRLECNSCKTSNEGDAKFCKCCAEPIENTEDAMIGNLHWSGYDSGKLFTSEFIKKIAPVIKGRLEAIAFVYKNDDYEEEGGPVSFHGFSVENGIYRRCDVNIELIPRPGRSRMRTAEDEQFEEE